LYLVVMTPSEKEGGKEFVRPMAENNREIGNFSYIKSLLVASTRVSDYFIYRKWPQFIINILNVALIPIIFNQIAFLSATLAVYRH
jgi:hypothetical protein